MKSAVLVFPGINPVSATWRERIRLISGAEPAMV